MKSTASWIVIDERDGNIELVSSKNTTGILPKGSYLTIEDGDTKFILRVINSFQKAKYSPSPLMTATYSDSLKSDQELMNILVARRVRTISMRNDGLIDFIKPQSVARISTLDEIRYVINKDKKGPSVFLAGSQYSETKKILDANGRYVFVNIPEDFFYHQIMICGKTGSGKTVASKYLAKYFIEETDGAVLAINVKDIDFLEMYKPSTKTTNEIEKEWEELGIEPKGIENFVIYEPVTIKTPRVIDDEYVKKIHFETKNIDPDALTGILTNLSDIGSETLPDIFRYWKEEKMDKSDDFSNFIDYLRTSGWKDIPIKTKTGDLSTIPLHKSTFNNILRNLEKVRRFFDSKDKDVVHISSEHVLASGKMSVINIAGQGGILFGSIFLRDILRKIVEEKNNNQDLSDIPILIIIDEVHQFYDNESSRSALSDLSTICRTGRSKRIGIIFSSQNPSDIPRGLSSVINTKIIFRTGITNLKQYGIDIKDVDIEGMESGYAVASIYGLPNVKIVKFPLSPAGVV